LKDLSLENTTALFIQFSLRILETNAVQNDSWTHIVMSETKPLLLLLLFVAISCYVPIKASGQWLSGVKGAHVCGL
jgi:hypothetical protein